MPLVVIKEKNNIHHIIEAESTLKALLIAKECFRISCHKMKQEIIFDEKKWPRIVVNYPVQDEKVASGWYYTEMTIEPFQPMTQADHL